MDDENIDDENIDDENIDDDGTVVNFEPAVYFELQWLQKMRERYLPKLSVPPRDPDFDTSVQLEHWGKDKSAVIHIFRDFAGYSLQEAKRLVDAAPCKITVPDAAKAIGLLRDAGASIDAPPDRRIHVFELPLDFCDGIPTLALKPRWHCIAQVYNHDGGSRVRVFAVPPSCPISFAIYDAIHGQEPNGCCEFLNAIVGDRSTESLMSASLLDRDISEVGAEWHGIVWGAQKLIDRVPDLKWTWLVDIGKATDLRPSVTSLGNGRHKVVVYTESGLGQNSIYCHVDQYRSQSYNFKTTVTRVATAPGGYVY